MTNTRSKWSKKFDKEMLTEEWEKLEDKLWDLSVIGEKGINPVIEQANKFKQFLKKIIC